MSATPGQGVRPRAARGMSDVPGQGTMLLRLVVLKALFMGVIFAVASAQPSESPYLHAREPGTNDLVWYLARGFDAHSYQRMSVEGYYDEFSRSHPPGFPVWIAAVRLLVDNGQAAAVLASNLAAIAASLAFLALLRLYMARHAADPAAKPVAEAGAAAGSGAATGATLANPDLAALIFCALPGVLAYGTIAYSESTAIFLGVLAWWAYLRAEERRVPAAPRHLGWLLAASWVGAAAVLTRDLFIPLFLVFAVDAGLRWMRAAKEARGRALLEAAALLSSGLLLAPAFYYRFVAHDLGGVQERLWSVSFVPLGGPLSLIERVDAEFVVLIYASLPIALLLLVKLWRVDRRLVLLSATSLFLMLSFTGVAAQSFLRYVWALWPLALGALALRDRACLWALAAWMVFIAFFTGITHVQGTGPF